MAASHIQNLPSWAREMLIAERVGRLGLVDEDDRPRVLPVTFVLYEEALYSAVDDKPKREGEPARIRFLRRRPHAALTVDRYDDDWSKLAWVQVIGRIELLETASDPAGAEALRQKYAPYRRRSPMGPLLRLTPERVICWRASD